jgi:uncharacterized OsmC-like protein
MSEIVVAYEGAMRCRALHEESGTVVLTDAPKDNNGQGANFSPSEMLSVALGSCILSIMGIAARSWDADMTGAKAKVTKHMTDAPRRIASIRVEISVPGSFDARQREKLEAAAHACPVHAVLGIDAPITIVWLG